MFYDVLLCRTDIDVSIICYYRYGKILWWCQNAWKILYSKIIFHIVISLCNNIHKKHILISINSYSENVISLILSSILNAYIYHSLISLVHGYVNISVLVDTTSSNKYCENYIYSKFWKKSFHTMIICKYQIVANNIKVSHCFDKINY